MSQPASTTLSTAAAYQHPPGYRMRRGRNWFGLGLMYASYYLCRYNLSPVANELKSALGLSNSQFGLINSGRDFFYAIGQMINGLMTDRLGGKLAMTIGAVATIVLNLLFGVSVLSSLSFVLPLLILIRSADGYFQAFGAPGFIKINTAWFRRRERGAFTGIFGAMINLGAIGAGLLGTMLATGAAIPLFFTTLVIPGLEWHYMFFIPPIAVAVVVVLMNLMVKNNPEEAGFRVSHDEEEEPKTDSDAKVRLGDVWRKMSSNPVIWVVASAYFCTGFVRRAIESWYAVYLKEAWHAGRDSGLYLTMAIMLPVTAIVGSMASGYISDIFFKGRRSPVAAVLYLAQAALTVVALFLPHHGSGSAPWIAISVVILISMMCNSTHSILGAAAPMDLGGRKMAGCASGIIDSFQYYGAFLSGYALGWFLDRFAINAPLATTSTAAATTAPAAVINPTVWFVSMLPFGIVGAGLMCYLWLRYRGTDTRGT